MEAEGGQMIYPSSEGVPLNSLPVAPIHYQSFSVQRRYVDQRTEISTMWNSTSQPCPALDFQTGPYKAM